MSRIASVGAFRSGLLTALIATASATQSAENNRWADGIVAASDIAGGLCVQVGAGDMGGCRELAQTGRFLVHVLDPDPAAVLRARQSLQGQDLYGLVSVDRLRAPQKLPYAENLVNLLLIEEGSRTEPPLSEIVRVLCPRGVLLAPEGKLSRAELDSAGFEDVGTVTLGGRRLIARKPWPDQMDTWSHPRHAADGNAVSDDALVGPPRRVRWVSGPPQEISNMVTAVGRNYYGGVLARDGFNGLRLWRYGLNPSPARGGFDFRFAPESVRPVAMGGLLLVVTEGKVLALDGATGKTVRQYPEAGTPSDVLHVEGTLIAVDAGSVRAVDPDGGRPCWKVDADGPRYVVAGDGALYFMEGTPRRGQQCTAVCLDLDGGKVRWRRDDFPWAAEVRRCVYDRGLLAYEVSTLNDDKANNRIHVVSADDGTPLWSRTFVPGMAHKKQARAMFVGELLWVLDDRKCVGLDRQTGEVANTYPAGWGHCFPPVASRRYLFAGEMQLTDLETGRVDANHITKGNCSRDAGFVPANGLIYVTPKHCICWPMLRGYAALAPARPGGNPPIQLDHPEFRIEKGARPPEGDLARQTAAWWPCYRHDAWRSGSTTAGVPSELKVRWTAELGGWPGGAIADDWREDPFVHGPVTPPVIAGGRVFVARCDAHQLVALDAGSGEVCWRFTANGRIDTAPTIHRGLCLFGTKSGWVYCLRADDGRLVWRLQAAPLDERIVAYGQLESPWPVPGSVLVVDDEAFFAAGRQPLADGGIWVFAVDPPSGKVRWVARLNTVPQQGFYGGLGLEFDNFDLLHREGPNVAMSRWLFDRRTGRMTVEVESGFALLKTGGGAAMVPRGCWSYAPRHQDPHVKIRPCLRPLAVFRDNTLLGCAEDKQAVYRRDFDFAGGEKFNTAWSVRSAVRQTKDRSRSQRLARGATWSKKVLEDAAPEEQIAAMVLAGETLLVAGSSGGLTLLSGADGRLLARRELPAPVWDGMAVAAGRVFVSTRDGQLICLAP